MVKPSSQLVAEKLREANSLGRDLETAGRTQDAIAAYRAALAVDPLCAPAASNLARLLIAREESRAAVRLLEPVAAAAPFDPGLAVNFANALLGVGRALEAEQRLRAVVARVEAPAQAHNSLGIARYVQRDFAAAADSFGRAIAVAPAFAEAHENRALALLQLGRYAEAWPEYEWRWKNPSNTLTKRLFAQPTWDGQPLAGRTLLLHGEQGLGDTIQFVRFAAMVQKDAGRIVFACQESLVPLMRGVAGIDEVRILGESLSSFDCQAPLLSLPRMFDTTRESIPDPSPYLSADPDSGFTATGGLKIGVNWAGRPMHVDDPHRNRSCDAALLATLARAGVTLYSLQQGAPAPAPIVDVPPGAESLEAKARMIAALDLVITVDTAIAHLAAALGKPTWVLLPYCADWRWQAAQAWYRSIRTFRQTTPGDWLDVGRRLALALERWNPGVTNN